MVHLYHYDSGIDALHMVLLSLAGVLEPHECFSFRRGSETFMPASLIGDDLDRLMAAGEPGPMIVFDGHLFITTRWLRERCEQVPEVVNKAVILDTAHIVEAAWQRAPDAETSETPAAEVTLH
ncbi:hypothetical protein [Parahaliea mediterranea]|uniref:hypothetical protein n=1 Tax=Parahaliea mediterranea TaxID=651086 RepID=UPI000E2F5AA2|nr:hypothetical protein [Parahaliea mediterranea]